MGEIPSKEEMRQALEQRHDSQLQRKLSSASVAICGLGGLGSNIAICLARAGVGKLILIDFDRVDVTNLRRQQSVTRFFTDYINSRYSCGVMPVLVLKNRPNAALELYPTREAISLIFIPLYSKRILAFSTRRSKI